MLKMSSGRVNLTTIVTGLPLVVLTTTGAKSGLPRTLPVLCIRDKDDPNRLAIIASNWGQHHHQAWYFNFKAEPCATCSIDGQVRTYISHEASGEEYERFWQRAWRLTSAFRFASRGLGSDESGFVVGSDRHINP
jgi:deazaflavin-dependent oxidoreductase (nitroreductase family)